jgi:hypothetical protein
MIIQKWISSDGSELVPTTDVKINLTLPVLECEWSIQAFQGRVRELPHLFIRRDSSIRTDERDCTGFLKYLVVLGPQTMEEFHNLILFFKWTQNAHRE